jgi:hypothetical protein
VLEVLTALFLRVRVLLNDTGSLSERCQMLWRRCVQSKRREPSAWSFTLKARRCHETSGTTRPTIQRHFPREANVYLCCTHVQSTHRWIVTVRKQVRISSGLYCFWWNIRISYILLKVCRNIFLISFHLTVIVIYPKGPQNYFRTAIGYVFTQSSRQDTAIELPIYGLSDYGWDWFSVLKSQEFNLTLWFHQWI